MTSDPISSESQIDPQPAAIPPAPAEPGLVERPEGLTTTQARVLQALVAGTGVAAAARDAGVSRTMVYRWQKSDPKFTALLNAWRRQTLESARDRLIALSDTAVSAVQSAVSNGDGRLALQVLRLLEVERGARRGSDDPQEVGRRLAEQSKAHQLRMEHTFSYEYCRRFEEFMARQREESEELENG